MKKGSIWAAHPCIAYTYLSTNPPGVLPSPSAPTNNTLSLSLEPVLRRHQFFVPRAHYHATTMAKNHSYCGRLISNYFLGCSHSLLYVSVERNDAKAGWIFNNSLFVSWNPHENWTLIWGLWLKIVGWQVFWAHVNRTACVNDAKMDYKVSWAIVVSEYL